MRKSLFFSFVIAASIGHAQSGSIQKNGSTTTVKTNNGTVKIQPGTSNPSAKKFSFLGSYTMKFTNKDAKGKTTTGEIKSAYDEFKMATIPLFSDETEKNIRSIFDVRENTMTMLIDDLKKKKKSGMVMRMPKISVSGNKTETPAVSVSIQKTAETKIIDGFKCNKWVLTYSDGAKCEAWVTKDVTINTSEALSYFTAGMKGKKSSINTDCANIDGCALESTYTAKDGSTVFMKLTDIKKGKPAPAFFSEDGYQVMDVTGVEFFR